MSVHPVRLASKPVIEAIARSILRSDSDGDNNARLDEVMGMHCKHLKNSEVLWSSCRQTLMRPKMLAVAQFDRER